MKIIRNCKRFTQNHFQTGGVTFVAKRRDNIMAIQIVAPLQAMVVRAEDMEVFAGLDLFDEAIVDQIIDRLVAETDRRRLLCGRTRL